MFNFRFNKNNIFSNISNSFRGNRTSRFAGEYKVLNQEELHNFLNQDVCVLDVRTESEFRSIRVKNSINIPLNILSREILSVVPNKETKILVYCVTGERTKVAIQKLNSLDYKNIYIWGNGGLNTLKYRDILEY